MNNIEQKKIVALRVATTIDIDTSDMVIERTLEAFEDLLALNNLHKDNILSILLTVTPDIKSYNPATALRLHLDFTTIPMICAQEAFIENGLSLSIRALLHVNISQNQAIKHIYNHGAKTLRSDMK